MESHKAIDRLLKEIERNADHRLMLRLVSCARRYPKKSSIERSLVNFMQSEGCIFSHQRAECFRVLRYLSRLSPETLNLARSVLYSGAQDSYERVQAAYLLSRTELRPEAIDKCLALFEEEPDPYVQTALASLLVQRRRRNADIVRMLVFHPNERIRNLGRLFRCIKNDEPMARQRLRHSFRAEVPWLVCDNMPFLHLMAGSTNSQIQALLVAQLKASVRSDPRLGIREILKVLKTRAEASLASVHGSSD